ALLSGEIHEAELWGHVRGAYTGACEAHEGLIARAEGGTLFLDEINSLPLAVQAKLLRLLGEGEYRRVGDERDLRCDVRIIAATSISLPEAVRAGGFRMDLYQRLNCLPIRLPALRERREDIPLLIRHFVELHSSALGRPVPEVPPDVLGKLAAHDWPGN